MAASCTNSSVASPLTNSIVTVSGLMISMTLPTNCQSELGLTFVIVPASESERYTISPSASVAVESTETSWTSPLTWTTPMLVPSDTSVTTPSADVEASVPRAKSKIPVEST